MNEPKQPDTFYVVTDAEWAIDKACQELGVIEYEQHEIEITPEQLEALRTGDVLVAAVGSMGTAEYAVIVRLGHKA